MIGVYRDMLARLTDTCRRLKFQLVLDDDFIARFERRDGWTVVLNGDRASYPTFSISITRSTAPEASRSYAVWLLMQHFAPQLGPDRSRPSLENQLRFLEDFSKVIFGEEPSYRDAYLKLDRPS